MHPSPPVWRRYEWLQFFSYKIRRETAMLCESALSFHTPLDTSTVPAQWQYGGGHGTYMYGNHSGIGSMSILKGKSRAVYPIKSLDMVGICYNSYPYPQ